MMANSALDDRGRRGSAGAAWKGLGRPAQAASAAIAVVVVAAVLAPLLPLADPYDVDLAGRFAGPSGAHPLGTDSNGRDLLARLVWGARSSLLSPLIVAVVATSAGTAIAIAAAWRSGWLDAAVMRLFDVIFSFPGILLALLAVAVLGAGSLAAVITLSIAYTPYVGRIVRSAAVREVQQSYVSALWLQGQSTWRISVRHLLPNLRSIVLAQFTLTFGYSLIDLAALSFLGVGAPQDQPDWGVMVATGQTSLLKGYPQEGLYSGALLFITVLSFSVIGERLGGSRRSLRP